MKYAATYPALAHTAPIEPATGNVRARRRVLRIAASGGSTENAKTGKAPSTRVVIATVAATSSQKPQSSTRTGSCCTRAPSGSNPEKAMPRQLANTKSTTTKNTPANSITSKELTTTAVPNRMADTS